MKIVVVMRQVPDLIEPLEVADSGNRLDWEEVECLVNESDDHALEQAILIKEKSGATVTVVAFDLGEVDNALYTAAAKGADRIIKIPLDDDEPPGELAAAAMYAEAIKDLGADLVFVGCWAHDELHGTLGPRLAEALGLPHLGVVRGVNVGDDSSSVQAFKEYPGAVMARMKVTLPAVLGILGAEQPPRYVPVNRIRAAMKTTEFEEQEVQAPEVEAAVAVMRLYPPEAGERAEIIGGSEEEIGGRIADILAEKGLVK